MTDFIFILTIENLFRKKKSIFKYIKKYINNYCLSYQPELYYLCIPKLKREKACSWIQWTSMWAEWMERDTSRGGEWMRVGWLKGFVVSHLIIEQFSKEHSSLIPLIPAPLSLLWMPLSPENLTCSFNWSRAFWILI